MTRIDEYNQGNSVVSNYQTNACYSNIDLSLIKNEPVESVDYLTPTHQNFQQSNSPNQQQTFFYFCQQPNQLQQFSPQLPPTPPSPPNSLTNDTVPIEHQLKAENQANQNSNLNNLQVNNQVNNQVNRQINNQTANQINKNYPQNYSLNETTKQFELPHQSNQQVVNKYRKNNKNQSNHLKSYNLPEQMTKKQIKSSASTAKRNERERKRVRSVNFGFQNLRERLPNSEKKLSKVETLRSAVRYIRHLKELLNSSDCSTKIDKNEFLFNFIHQNTTLSSAIKNESNNELTIKNQKIFDQQDQTSSSSLDYFDLDELLS